MRNACVHAQKREQCHIRLGPLGCFCVSLAQDLEAMAAGKPEVYSTLNLVMRRKPMLGTQGLYHSVSQVKLRLWSQEGEQLQGNLAHHQVPHFRFARSSSMSLCGRSLMNNEDTVVPVTC